MFDMPYGTQVEDAVSTMAHYDVLAGPEGAGFVNSLFLPLGGGLLVVHGLKTNSDPENILQWHTNFAQYFGHSVVNFKASSSFLSKEVFFRSLTGNHLFI